MATNPRVTRAVKLALFSGAASAAVTSTPVLAQETEAGELEQIVVTGSRIRRVDAELGVSATGLRALAGAVPGDATRRSVEEARAMGADDEGWFTVRLRVESEEVALHQLITTRFRGDHLELIGFGRHAHTMQIEQLTALDARWEKGTNLHHALLLANRHFRRHAHEQPVLLIVTDGEPTSHLEPGGEVFFDYPPHPRTIALAVRELDAAARLGAQTTVFRLGEDAGLARFVDGMARRVGGRVVAPELGDLGAAVVGSYLGSRDPGSAFGSSYRDLFGGRGFWAE